MIPVQTSKNGLNLLENPNKIITTRLTGGLYQGYKPKLPASA